MTTPRGDNFGIKSVKFMGFFFLNLLHSWAQIRQTDYVVMMTKEGSTKIMTPKQGILC